MSKIVNRDWKNPRREFTADAPWGFIGSKTGQFPAIMCTGAVEMVTAEGEIGVPLLRSSEVGLDTEEAGRYGSHTDTEG